MSPSPLAVRGGALDGSLVAIGIPVFEGAEAPELLPGMPDRLEAGGQVLECALGTELARRRGFTGEAGRSLVTVSSSGPALVHVGCGRRGDFSPDTLRRGGADMVRAAGGFGSAAFVVPGAAIGGDPVKAVQALTEGAVLGAYTFSRHKSEPAAGRVDELVVHAPDVDPEAVDLGVERGRRVAEAVVFARDLVNEPPSTMTPTLLAEAASRYLGGVPGVSFEVWDERRIAEERLGGLMGVARGSAEPPRLLMAVYEPSDPRSADGRVPHVVLVGKGITFDSGGLSLKRPEGMMTMKTDMSGAAAVVGAVGACGGLGARVKVTAIAPVTENMPGGRATKPGDVLRIRNGRTVEVLNTDAEGRLVLADGLSLAAELQPDAIVDVATLTGACVVALGSGIAGLFGNDEALVDQVRRAARRAGEAVWPLPMPEQYRSHIDSEVADMKNTGKPGQAGAIAAAMLLARFTAEVPWAHLDIAGPARAEEEDGYLTKGGTGFGLRTLVELVEEFAA